MSQLLGSSTAIYSRKLLAPSLGDSSGLLRASILLEWIDEISCLAAERVSGRSMVTAQMSDLRLYEPCPCSTPGHTTILTLEATTTRTFGRSMEVYVEGHVHSFASSPAGRWPPLSDDSPARSPGEKRSKVLSCYFIYVVLAPPVAAGEPAPVVGPLPEIVPDTPAARQQFAQAMERRQLRMRVAEQRKQQQQSTEAASSSSSLLSRSVLLGSAASATSANKAENQLIELVLPQHANHHGSTFGGHVMSSMEQCAFVTATMFFGRAVVLLSVDDISFVAASSVGDRLVFKAAVNRAFGPSIEVGVRVDKIARPTTATATATTACSKINAGYFTYLVLSGDEHGPTDLRASMSSSFTLASQSPSLHDAFPQYAPGSADETRRYNAALERLQARMARNALRGNVQHSEVPVWQNGPADDELIAATVHSLLKLELCEPSRWRTVFSRHGVSFQRREKGGVEVVRAYFQLRCAAPLPDVLALLLDADKRRQWDSLYSYQLLRRIDEQNDLGVVSFDLPGAAVKSYIVLRAVRRFASAVEDRYVVANRAVQVPDLLADRPDASLAVAAAAAAASQASQPLPSGWSVARADDLLTVSYIIQVPSSELNQEFFQQELVGGSSVIAGNVLALQKTIAKLARTT